MEEEQRVTEQQIEGIAQSIENRHRNRLLVEDIQDMVESKLMALDKYALAKSYIIYRYTRALVRKQNTTDESILSLLHNTNKELAEENSNKNTVIASTQRDYIAGEVSRDLTRRILLPEKISKAHDEGVLHFHDADYFVQPIFNCCLINIGVFDSTFRSDLIQRLGDQERLNSFITDNIMGMLFVVLNILVFSVMLLLGCRAVSPETCRPHHHGLRGL